MLGFILGISDGYIALWRSGEASPERVFPYQAAHLPPADQRALAEGIYLEEESALIHLLEDYLS